MDGEANGIEPDKKILAVRPKRISDMGPAVVGPAKKVLSGMEPNSYQLITIEGAENTSVLFLVGKDSKSRMHSIPMFREPELDAWIIR